MVHLGDAMAELRSDVLITCKSCRNRFPMRELRYDRKGENLVCKGCFSSSSSPKQGMAVSSLRDIPPEKLEPTGPRSRVAGGLIRYYCAACRFKFSRKGDFHFENCPSCGKGSIKREVPLTSSQLLEESGDYFG